MNRSLYLSVALLGLTSGGLHAQPPGPAVTGTGEAPIVPLQAELFQPEPAAAVPSQPSGSTPLLLPPASPLLTPAGAGVESQSFATRSTLTGDWWGARTRLEDRGIKFDGNITQFAFGLGGGINTPRVPPPLGQGDVFAYTGRGVYNLAFDLEKFGGLPKGKLNVGFQNWWGQFGNVSLNSGAFTQPVIGALLPPTPNDPGIPYMTDFNIVQPLSKNFVVYAGKKNIIGSIDQDDFAGGDGTSQFSNFGLVGNPSVLLAMPYSGFHAGFVSPQEWGRFSGFVIDPRNRTQDFFRLNDLNLFRDGIIVGTEVRVKTNFFNMPGEQHVGGLWKHVELTNLAFDEPPPGVYPYPTVPGSPTLNDSFTIFYGMDQYLQVYSEDSKRGWGVFGRASISDGNPTPIRYFLSAGIGGYSPFRHRQGDTFGIGWYYVGFSDQFGPRPRALFGPQDGTGVEIFYNYQMTPWMTVTPDFQIVRPESGRIADTSYIGGLRLNLKF